jgi:hypothetical protein
MEEKMLTKIVILSDGETWDYANNCDTLDLTEEQLEELERGTPLKELMWQLDMEEYSKGDI